MNTLLEQIEHLNANEQRTVLLHLLRTFAAKHTPAEVQQTLAECDVLPTKAVTHVDLNPAEFRQAVYQEIDDYVKELAQRTEYQRPATASVPE